MKTMQKNKIVLAVTAVVVLALLFAGVGYATFTGNARTYNQGDEQTLAYMSVTPSDFDPFFTDAITNKTIFNTYAYEDANPTDPALVAYAFNVNQETNQETVVEVDTGAAVYKAVQLGEKTLKVKNETGAAITALNVEITASGATGNTDFVYIFKLKATGDAKFIVFNGSSVTGSVSELAAAIADKANTNITVTVYVGYEPDVYVPSNYIGPAADNAAGYAKAAYWKDGVQYYSDKNGTTASPTAENFDEGTYYVKYTDPLPYKQSTTGPIDLAKTDFSFKVTDAS